MYIQIKANCEQEYLDLSPRATAELAYHLASLSLVSLTL